MPDSNPNLLFESAFEYAAIGMAVVAPDGRWLRVNPCACRMVGYTEKELRVRSFRDITHPDNLESDLAQMRKMVSGEIPSCQMETRYLHKDGRVIWVILSVSLVRHEDGLPKFFIAQIIEVTARKEAERARELALREKDVLLAELNESGRLLNELRDKLVTICAWTKQIRHDGVWMSTEEFLADHLNLSLTHGISDDAMEATLDDAMTKAARTGAQPGAAA
jgi:PAS domain S-box-containing protein